MIKDRIMICLYINGSLKYYFGCIGLLLKLVKLKIRVDLLGRKSGKFEGGKTELQKVN